MKSEDNIMKKIMPAVIVTAAAVAAAVTYIKRRIDKQNKVNFIEVEIKPEKTVKHTLKKVGDVAENIVSVGKEILIETVDTVGDVVEPLLKILQTLGKSLMRLKKATKKYRKSLLNQKIKVMMKLKKQLTKSKTMMRK